MPQQLEEGLRRFREHYRRLVAEGQRPSTLFLGCADSRVVPELLTSTLPGDLFVIRNVGNLVPPFEPGSGCYETSAGIEFATLVLEVKDIVVCGHSHCGAIKALLTPERDDAPNLTRWLEQARPAVVDVGVTEANLRRTEMRSVGLQLERLMGFPTVRERVDRGELCLHGWYYVIEEGQVLGLDRDSGEFRPLS